MLICRCHERRRAAEKLATKRTVRLATVVGLIVELDPTVTSRQVEDLLAQVAPAAQARTLLLGHLADHPAVLTSGGSSMPKLAGEFLYAAIDAGIAGLVAPGCALCQRPRTLFHTHDDGQRICTT